MVVRFFIDLRVGFHWHKVTKPPELNQTDLIDAMVHVSLTA